MTEDEEMKRASEGMSFRYEIIEYQSASRLRFELVKRGVGVIRAVEALWSEVKDLGARNRLIGSLFEGEPHAECKERE
jgi:hypothetical protein